MNKGKAAKALIILLSMLLVLSMMPAVSFAVGEDADGGASENIYPEGFEMSVPVVWINVDGGQAAIDRMNGDDYHKEKCTGTMDIEVPEGFAGYSDQASGTSVKSLEGLKLEIRGRGNSTWIHSGKRPYKIKLKNKESLLGMDAGKHWALIANAFDPSMMRNRLTFWLGRQMGMAYTPTGYPVDVFMGSEKDGYEYYGSYLLCEIAKNHIDIDQVDGSSTDITGGYLMSVVQDPGTPGVFTTGKLEELQNIDPSFDPDEGEGFTDDTQKNYIRNFVNEAECALFEGEIQDTSDPSVYHKLNYLDYFDTESAAKFWLFEYFTLNGDAYGNGSTYFYKTKDGDDGEQGKIYWGPLWDYDFAWDYVMYDEEYINLMKWIPALMGQKDGITLTQAKEAWNNEMKPALLEAVEEGGIIDQYYDETLISQRCDYQLNSEYYPEDDVAEDYSEAVENFRDWIIKRISIFDKYIYNDIEPFSHAVYFKLSPDDEHPQVVYIQHSFNVDKNAVKRPEKKGYVFTGWVTEDGTDSSAVLVNDEMTVYPSFVKEEDASRYEKIYFAKYDVYCTLDEDKYYTCVTYVPEEVLDNRITWKSSDESVASVDDEGVVSFHKTGKVRISATTPFGVTNSYDLTITDTIRSYLESVYLPETVYIKAGDVKQIRHKVNPTDCSYSIVFEQENNGDEAADVDTYGVVKANKPGITTCTATFSYTDKNNDGLEIVKTCRIIVSESEGKLTTSTKTSGIKGKALNLDKAAEKLLTDGDTADIEGGANAKVWLSMTRIDEDDAPEDDRQILNDYLDDNNMDGGCWIDISLFKKVGEKTVRLHESEVPVRFSVTIPEELRNDDPDVERKFYLLRAHDGEVSTIASGTENVLTGESSQFSTYMLAYEDSIYDNSSGGTDKDNDRGRTPRTGDESGLILWVVVMLSAMISLAAIIRARVISRK